MAPAAGAGRRRRGKPRPGRAIAEDEDDADDYEDEEDSYDDYDGFRSDDDDDDDDVSEVLASPRSHRGGAPRGPVWEDERWSGRTHGTGSGNQATVYGGDLDGSGPPSGGGGASILGVETIPAIYKTAEGACAVDIPLAGVSTVRALLEAVVHLGQAMVDADISAGTIKVHYAVGPGIKPTRITRETTLWDLREATGLVVTPRSDS